MKTYLMISLLVMLLSSVLPFNRQSGATWSEYGSIYALANLGVFCNDGEALNAFQLFSINNNNDIEYYFNCVKNSAFNILGSYIGYTGWNNVNLDIFQSNNYLDRHSVYCNDDYALNGFQLEYSNGSIRYRFKCVPAKDYSSGSSNTGWATGNPGQNWFLQGLNLSLGNSQVLNGFHLENSYWSNKVWFVTTSSGWNFRYNFNYLNYRDIDAEKQYYQYHKHSPRIN